MGNEVYYRRKAAHKCVNCGAPLPNEETRLSCAACREVKAEKQKTLYDVRRERKLCTRCGKRPALPGTQVCEECREKVMVAVKRRRWAGVAFGILLSFAMANNTHAAEIDIRSDAVEITEGPESAVYVAGAVDGFTPCEDVNLSPGLQEYLWNACAARWEDPEELYKFMLGLIDAESEFKPTAYHKNKNGSTDRGLCQTNSCHLKALKAAGIIQSKESLYDPYTSIDACMWELDKKLNEYGVTERLYYFYNTGSEKGSSNANSRRMVEKWKFWNAVIEAQKARDKTINSIYDPYGVPWFQREVDE